MLWLAETGRERCEPLAPGVGEAVAYGPQSFLAISVCVALGFFGGRPLPGPVFVIGGEALQGGACFDPAKDLLAVGLLQAGEAVLEQQRVFVAVTGGVEQLPSCEAFPDEVGRGIGPNPQDMQ